MAREFDTPPAGRPIQWHDLSRGSRRQVDANMRQAGMNLTSSFEARTQKEKEKSVSAGSESGRKAARVAAAAFGAVQPELRDKPVTVAHAATRRANIYKDAERETPGNVPHGTGWYYEHHRELRDAGHQHGVDPDTVITASAVMSPQNNPQNEKAAVKGLMNVFSHHEIDVTPDVAKAVHASSKGKVDLTPHVGQRVRADQLPRGAVAHLSSTSVRDRVQGTPGIQQELYQISRGGTKDQNITNAERLLMGETHPDEAINPHSASKVWSYAHTIRNAQPDSPAHVEHVSRVRHNAMIRSGEISPQQQALDIYPDQPENSLLHRRAHTVEDTWMNSVSFGQNTSLVGHGNKTSVMKTAGSLPRVSYPPKDITQGDVHNYRTKDVPRSAILHGFNNRATQEAASRLTERGSDLEVPPTAVQEGVWMHARRQAGKTQESENMPPTMSDLHAEAQKEHQARQSPTPGQQALFGPHVGGSSRVGPSEAVHTDPGPNLTAAQQERELRSAEFASRARSRRGGSEARSARLNEAAERGRSRGWQ